MKNISKHMRKTLALTIVCCLLMATISPISVSAKDISKHWAVIDNNYLRGKGIVRGYDIGDINPDNNITRAADAQFSIENEQPDASDDDEESPNCFDKAEVEFLQSVQAFMTEGEITYGEAFEDPNFLKS